MARADSAPWPLLLRGRIRLRAGDAAGAVADAEAARALDPDDPRSTALLGSALLAGGRAKSALVELDRALLRGADPAAHAERARALDQLGESRAAVEAWTVALRHDPDDPRLLVGRARTFLSLHLVDPALADLESAAELAGDRPDLLGDLISAYRACLADRPDRRARVAELERRGRP